MHWKEVRQTPPKIARKLGRFVLDTAGKAAGPGATAGTGEFRPVQIDRRWLPRSRRIWLICLTSLPFDILVFFSFKGALEKPAAGNFALVILLCLAILALFRQEVFLGAALFRHIRDRILFRSTRIAVVILLFLILASVFVDAWFRHHGSGGMSFLLPLVAVLAAAVPAFNTVRERVHRLQRKSRNRLIWVEELDKQRFFLLLLPLVPSRLISLCAALTVPDKFYFSLYFLTSILLLLHSEPRENDFFVLCRRCLSRTSRSLAGMRYCPDCARISFHVPTASDSRGQE